MQPIPYLFFPGTCEEAIRAYADIFGSPEPQIMREGEAPAFEGMSGDPSRIMHAALKVGDGWLYASDYRDSEPMKGSYVAVSFPSPEEGRRVFDALSAGGEVDMAFAPTFWGPGFGSLTDRWGTRWMVDTDAPPGAA